MADIPNIVIKKRFLYRKRFLNVDFVVKLSLFQINGTYSSSTLFPFFGASGRISSAGTSLSSLRQENAVAARIHTKDISMA